MMKMDNKIVLAFLLGMAIVLTGNVYYYEDDRVEQVIQQRELDDKNKAINYLVKSTNHLIKAAMKSKQFIPIEDTAFVLQYNKEVQASMAYFDSVGTIIKKYD